MTFRLVSGDCLDALAEMPEASVDAVVTDPPYGLEFMGKDWDAPWKATGDVVKDPAEVGGFQDGNGGNPYSRSRIRYGAGNGFQQWTEAWATELLRVLKPGGHLLAFGGTRTYHRLACGIEDAGFEVRDCLAWMYGSGFPKSLDVSKAIDKAAGALSHEGRGMLDDRTGTMTLRPHIKPSEYEPPAPATPAAQKWQGWGTALKPAFEPIILARKPLIGTVAENVTRYGTGALNIDGCRVGTADGHGGGAKASGGFVTGYEGDGFVPSDKGRWPANLILDEEAAAMLDEQSGESVSRFFASFDSSTMDQCPQPGERSTKDANTSAGRRAEKNAVDSPTDGSGNKNTDRSRPATTSTTETTTRSTTTSKTSNSSSADDTNDITVNSEPPKSSETESADARSVENGNLSSTSTQGQPDHDRQSAENVVAHTSENGESETGSGTTPICANTANGTQPQTRFFYQAKASRAERNAGLDGFEERQTGALNMRSEADGHAVRTGQVPKARANVHPTVKPIDLMRWLVRLVTPPGGTVLDPFTGSGTTGIAAGLEGFDFIGIEREAEYREIAEARLKWWADKEGETAEILRRAGLAEKERERAEAVGQTSLFDEEAA